MVKEKKVKVLICHPRVGSTATECVDNQIDMAFYLGNLEAKSNFKFYFGTIGRLLIAKAREDFAQYCIDHDCDYLMMIDDDMIVPVKLFEMLYRHNVDIVAPLAFQRRDPFYPVIYRNKEGYDKATKQRFFSNETVENYPKNTLFECDAVGFGAVLIKKEVIVKMPLPRFMSSTATGEDILFCYNARKIPGVKIYCDTATKIAHLGDHHIITEETFESATQNKKLREVKGDCKEEL